MRPWLILTTDMAYRRRHTERPDLIFRDTDGVSIFSVSLSLSSETLTLVELTAIAGEQPTDSHIKGTRKSLRMPASRVYEDTHWGKDSGIALDTWTLEPHWPMIEPVLLSLSSHDLEDVEVTLSIGINSRSMGFAFQFPVEYLALLSSARCSVSIDSYEANRNTDDLPDDYPYATGGTLLPPRLWRRARRRLNWALRAVNPWGKVRRHSARVETSNQDAAEAGRRFLADSDPFE